MYVGVDTCDVCSVIRASSGLHVSAETYYACQGRVDNLFQDRNEQLLSQLLEFGIDSMDMESHQLVHLANRRFQPVKAAAAHIGIVSRTNDQYAHPITVSPPLGTTKRRRRRTGSRRISEDPERMNSEGVQARTG